MVIAIIESNALIAELVPLVYEGGGDLLCHGLDDLLGHVGGDRQLLLQLSLPVPDQEREGGGGCWSVAEPVLILFKKIPILVRYSTKVNKRVLTADSTADYVTSLEGAEKKKSVHNGFIIIFLYFMCIMQTRHYHGETKAFWFVLAPPPIQHMRQRGGGGYRGIKLYPLTTSTESYSELAEIFTTDSSYFLKNKKFLHEFFSSSGYQETRNLVFFPYF